MLLAFGQSADAFSVLQRTREELERQVREKLKGAMQRQESSARIAAMIGEEDQDVIVEAEELRSELRTAQQEARIARENLESYSESLNAAKATSIRLEAEKTTLQRDCDKAVESARAEVQQVKTILGQYQERERKQTRSQSVGMTPPRDGSLTGRSGAGNTPKFLTEAPKIHVTPPAEKAASAAGAAATDTKTAKAPVVEDKEPKGIAVAAVASGEPVNPIT